ncbi:long-chain-fatty-acid--CoA ligase [compost metagenome]
MGEAVKAVIEVAPGTEGTAALAEELIAFVRSRVSRCMVPRSVDFIDVMLRMPTGKLSKKALREHFLIAM